MSQVLTHSFSISVAQKVGVHGAIIMQHFAHWHILNWGNGKNYHDGRFWTFNSVKAYCSIFPYMTIKEIRGQLDRLERDQYIVSGNYNATQFNRTKWYAMTSTGLDLMQIEEEKRHLPFRQMDFTKGQFDSTKGQFDYPKGQMNDRYNTDIYTDIETGNDVADATAPPLTGPFEKVGEVEIPSKPEPRVSGIAASRGGRRGAAEKDTHDPWTKTIASLFDRVGAECGIAEPFNWQVNAGRDFKALKEIRKGLTADIAKKKAGAEPTETEIETGFEYLFRYGYKYLSDIASQKGGAVQYNPATIKNCYNQIISYAKAKRPTGTSKAEQNRHDMAEYLAGRRRAAFTRLYGEEVGTAAEV